MVADRGGVARGMGSARAGSCRRAVGAAAYGIPAVFVMAAPLILVYAASRLTVRMPRYQAA